MPPRHEQANATAIVEPGTERHEQANAIAIVEPGTEWRPAKRGKGKKAKA
jgi:hypothetical protein